MTARKWFLLLTAGLGVALGLLGTCSRLPSLANRTSSVARTDTDGTRLGRAISPTAAQHPNLSGIYPLANGRDAFAARLLLTRAAEFTLDIQYYIWNKDMSGMLMFGAVRDAAERGVRVRLLMDDNSTSGLDAILAALDTHPNIEVRLFNPLVIRKPRVLGYITDFQRVNRRMHNKTFTADNQATIIGGRNIGDEYFDAGGDLLFVDLDVIAVGPVVRDVSGDFDRYWSSESAYPAELLLPAAGTSDVAELRTGVARVENDPAALAYLDAVRTSPFVGQLVERTLPLEWATTRMISDDPGKALGRADGDGLLFAKMREVFGEPVSQVDLVSPYFVPGRRGVELFTSWKKKGVRVRVLTNSLAATDVPAVHAGYAKRRKALLEAGVELSESRRTPEQGQTRHSGPFGSSSSSLHAKTFAVDHARIFVGSFNFDPRSIRLNTEIGFVIDSPALAERIEAAFDQTIPQSSYQLKLSNRGRIQWLELRGKEVILYDTEPDTSVWLRARVGVLSLLPIDWLL